MNLASFTDPQRQALLDLAVLGMYVDGHLAAAEDERVGRVLTAMGYATEYERARQYDASVVRVTRFLGQPSEIRTHTLSLAQAFTTPEQRRFVHNLLQDLVASDGRVVPQESHFLAAVREGLEI